MSFDPLKEIRKRNRSEWQIFLREKWTNCRIWVQENAELGTVLAFLAGIFLILAFRLVITLVIIAALLGLAAWLYALPPGEPERDNKGDTNSP